MDRTLQKVFVYGTLKKGQPNHFWLTSGEGFARFVGEVKTVDRYPLVIATDKNIPMVLDAKNHERAHHIQGELYEVDDVMLGRLDVLERVPEHYDRVVFLLQLISSPEDLTLQGDAPEIIEALGYILKDFKPEVLEQPFFDCYDSLGPHGLVYVMPSKRTVGPQQTSPFNQVKIHCVSAAPMNSG